MNVSLRVPVKTQRAFKGLGWPVEIKIAFGFTVFWLACLAAGLPISLPSLDQAPLLEIHFFVPIVFASLAQFVVIVAAKITGSRRLRPVADAYVMLKLLPLVVVSVILYFDFKAWMPLVNTRLYDPLFQSIDQAGAPLLAAMLATRQAIASHIPIDVDSWYLGLFCAMFICSFLAHAIVDSPYRQRQLVLGVCLNLLLGGLSYWIMPAEGPFLYRAGANLDATNAQWLMHEAFLNVRATGVLPPGYFLFPLGAMPSLHVAHSLLLTLNARRSARFLLVLYLPLLFWIVIEASCSGWHYLVDLPAGALLAILSYIVAQRLIPAPDSSNY